MWRQNILITYRSFIRNKGSFLINLVGLSSGLACAILIYMWVQDELRVDGFHENGDQLYQVLQRINSNENDVLVWEWTPGLLAQTLREEFPEVDMSVPMVLLDDSGIAGHEDTRYKARELYVGPDFFELFSFELIHGDKQSVLNEINQVALSETLAKKLFGTAQGAVGQSIEWERTRENVAGTFTVAGIFRDPPANSTLQFDLAFTYKHYFKGKPDLEYWKNSEPWTFVRLKEGTDQSSFDEKIAGLVMEKDANSVSTLFTRKFADTYLHGNYENGVQAGGRIAYVRLFSLIALFIILIACINFMNLSTAQSARRHKEIGIKKTVGARRTSLIAQYLSESTMLAFLSLFAALSIISFSTPVFNKITGKQLSLEAEPTMVLTLLGITLLTGLIAGSYPALYLSAFRPVSILKGQINRSPLELWARKGLVVFQFALTAILIVSVIVIDRQMQFVQGKNLGYSRDNVMVFHKDGTIRENTPAFLSEINKIPGVAEASTFDGDMIGNYGFTSTIRWEGYEDPENPVRFGVMIVGQNITETLKLDILAGQNFREAQGARAQILINEKAAETIGFADPIGKIIRHRREECEIVGVVRDFHFESLYDEIKPCVLRKGTYGNNIYVRLQAGAEAAAIARIDEVYQRFNPGLPFEFQFLDDKYQQLYIAEQRVASLSRYFAGLAILISCLGLFGLASFAAERRTKEISIRKILGSSSLGIVRLLSQDLVGMVLVSLLIALPASLLLARGWLADFAFRINLQVWFFAVAGLAVLLVAMLTVGIQGFRSAIANPVDSLRQD